MTDRQKYMKKYNQDYSKSHKGLIKRIYKHQIRNCKERQHPLPNYTEEELLAWYIADNKHLQLHQTWLDSGCDKELTPSIDRLDNNRSYTFDNIEVVTWKENCIRAQQQIRDNTLSNSGLLNNGHTAVVQYNLSGDRIAEFISLAEAQRTTGIDHRGISECCRKARTTFHGYVWRYLADEQELIETPLEVFAKWKKSYTASIGYLVDILYVDGTTETLTVPATAHLLGISLHNVRQLAKGINSNRAPKLPSNIISLYLKDKY